MTTCPAVTSGSFRESNVAARLRATMYSSCGGLLAFIAIACAMPARAQTPAILLGNPQITQGLQSQGYVITNSVSQTGTSTSITYNVTPPAGGSPGAGQVIGRIFFETVLPSGSFAVPATFNVTFTGSLYVITYGGPLPLSSLGANLGTSPQQKTGNVFAGKGALNFALLQSSSPSTITITISMGSPNGGRLPYLNDFLGIGQSNIAVWRPSNSSWYVYDLLSQSPGVYFGIAGDIPVQGDYDGDGFTDYAVWRSSQSNWYVHLSSTGQTETYPWGAPGDIPVPADYDGDGKTDLAIFRPSEGNWYIRLSSTGQTDIEAWGDSQDIPVPADYDGDGKADLAIFRPSDGTFYIRSNSTGQTRVEPWGENGDVPVVGDYDGDGIADLAIWRPADGSWWVRMSSTGQTTVAQWGQSGDIPVPGDFDGDGKNDYVVFRPSNATWYINGTQGGTEVPNQFGISTDLPVGKLLGAP